MVLFQPPSSEEWPPEVNIPAYNETQNMNDTVHDPGPRHETKTNTQHKQKYKQTHKLNSHGGPATGLATVKVPPENLVFKVTLSKSSLMVNSGHILVVQLGFWG